MAITEKTNAFVDQSAAQIALSQMFTTTAGSSDPTYLVPTVLDRNEYTAGATGTTGSLVGNGHVLNLSSIGSDGRGAGIVFTYQASTGRYYNSTYGYLDQLVYDSSGSIGDVTNLSLFGTSNLTEANAYAANAYDMMQVDPSGYIGSATVATQGSFTGTVPSQATPDSIIAAAEGFVGKAWNMDGCWVLASTIAAEAGASLPVQSTAIGVPGQDNGEWIVAYNGPAGASGNWQSMVTAGEIIVIGTSGGGGHITTCVSGSGSSAMLVDNITYVNSSDQILNSANDGSSSDVAVAAPHAASQEWSGVQASSVVIYELDTPIVTDAVSGDKLAAGASQSLGSLFTATDPAGKAIAEWQVYESSSADSLVLGGVDYHDLTAASALTTASLAAMSLLASSGSGSDVLEVRAYNGSYWGDWTSLTVAVAAASPPVLKTQTAALTWLAGKPVSLTLPAAAFTDPQNESLSYTARLSNGQALPSWLAFNATTETFSGTAPAAAQTLSIVVTATDTSGLSVSETISATVVGLPEVSASTPGQTWLGGKAVSLTLPGSTFTDPQGQKLSYKATLSNGLALPAWLTFNAATETFSGTAPAAAQTLAIVVTATDTSGLSASETISATIIGTPIVSSATAQQDWIQGKAISFVLSGNTFTDPQGQKLSYTAKLSNGQALPSWLTFNPADETFSGTAPAAAQTLGITVTATDASGLSASEIFQAEVIGAPTVTAATANQSWTEGKAIAFALPANTFTDPQGQRLTYAAKLSNGAALPNWLTFNATTGTFAGTAPATAQSLGITVTATDASGLSASESFTAGVAPAASGGIAISAATPSLTCVDGQPTTYFVPAAMFTDTLGLKMTFAAYETAGANASSWLHFNAAQDELYGTAPAGGSGTVQIAVIATDTKAMTAEDLFTVSFAPNLAASVSDSQTPSISLAASVDPTHVSSLIALHT